MGRKCLGLSFANRAIHIAEVQLSGQAANLTRSAQLQLGENELQKDAAGVGRRLVAFLKEKQFSARVAVAGIPAQWLMVKEKSLPPAAPEMLAGMLRIQAERDFSFDPAALALDYATGTSGENGQAVILAATLRERVDAITALCAAAGLKLQAVSSTTLAVADGAKFALYLGRNGVEMISETGGVRVPRPVGAPSALEDPVALGAELRRVMLFQPALGAIKEWVVWDDAGLEGPLLQKIGSEAGLLLRSSHTVSGLQAPPGALGATALALLRLRGALPLDFLHSRLEVKPPSKLDARARWSIAAAALCVLVFGYLIIDWQSIASEVGELKASRAGMKESVDDAKAFIDRVDATKSWYTKRPNYLECMRTITLCFPEEGRVWTSNLTLREDMRGILTGRAVDEKSVLDVMDKLKSNPALAEVKMLHLRSSGGKTNEISFSISFAYKGAG